jgi:hypothetical protein
LKTIFMIRTFLCLVVISSIVVGTPAKAQHVSLALKPSVEIADIQVLGEAKRGDTFEILVRYRSLIDADGAVGIRIPQHAVFSGRSIADRAVTEERNFTREQARTERFAIQADENGDGIYSFTIHVPDAPVGYSRSAERWIKIITTDEGFEVFDPLNPGDRQPMEIGKDIQTFMGERSDRGKNNALGMQIQSLNYSVSVSGKIRFYTGYPEFAYRGVYGNGVVLWFRNSSNPGTWYHPVYASSPVQGTHFDILDEQGNFSFNFNFTGDLSGYNELIVLVNTANSAAIMPAPQDGYISWSGGGYTAYFNESEGLQVTINPSQTTISINQNGEVNSQWGRVLRYSTLSKEFTQELYGGNMTFSVPAIPTQITGATACGTFWNNWSFLNGWSQSIELNPNCTDFTTVSHEFGHWTHYRMWTNNTKWNNANDNLVEGFAIFNSFAVRNYANRQYGDDIIEDDDNTEEDSFVGSPYRYFGIRYAQPSAPSFGKSAAAFSSYLWNLYDDPVDNTFLASVYSSGDNDDLNGHSVRTFERMRTLGTTSVSNYHSHFKSGFPSEEQTSVNKIYNFMFDDLNSIPSSKMLSAQIENFVAILGSGQVSFSWQPRSYPSGNYANTESGYRLYKDSGSGWQLVQTISVGNNNYTYYTSTPNAYFRLTSYNSEGESSNAPIVSTILSPPSLSLNTSGFSPELNWGSVTGATSYKIYSGTVAGAPGTVNCNSVSSFSHLDTTSSTTYTDYSVIIDPYESLFVCYYVIAVHGSSESNPSNEVGTHAMAPLKQITDRQIPDEYSLFQNYPNPFNPSTTFAFGIPEEAHVSLKVYNMTGQLVATLMSDPMSAGFHEVNWQADRYPSGIYLLHMQAVGVSGQSHRFMQKLTLLK